MSARSGRNSSLKPNNPIHSFFGLNIDTPPEKPQDRNGIVFAGKNAGPELFRVARAGALSTR